MCANCAAPVIAEEDMWFLRISAAERKAHRIAQRQLETAREGTAGVVREVIMRRHADGAVEVHGRTQSQLFRGV